MKQAWSRHREHVVPTQQALTGPQLHLHSTPAPPHARTPPLFPPARSLEAGQPEQRRESSLKFQTRCVRCFTDGAGYALASVEGRVAMEFFDPSEAAQVHRALMPCALPGSAPALQGQAGTGP